MDIYIHHHSFNYLNRKSKLFSIANKIAGKQATHIVLGERMRDILCVRYEIPSEKIRVQSNLAFFDQGENSIPGTTSGKLIIGHLANLTFDKGLDTFIEICHQLTEQHIEFEAYIAGPTSGKEVADLIKETTDLLPHVKYIGPLYGDQKLDFYRMLDVFIFPSKYVNEAEPLVLYEAATHGALVIGTKRGCMQQVIQNLHGFSCDEDSKLAENITHAIINTLKDNGFSGTQRAMRARQYQEIQQGAKHALKELIRDFTSPHVSKS